LADEVFARAWVEAGVGQLEILAGEAGALLGPQQLDRLQRLLEAAQAAADRMERNAVLLMFEFEPYGAEAENQGPLLMISTVAAIFANTAG
jgi:hypothetical protein